MAFVMGFLINRLNFIDKPSSEPLIKKNCCDQSGESDTTNSTFSNKMIKALRYAFVVLPKEIGPEILMGIALASFITVFEPIQHFVQEYLSGVVGYVFILITGLLTYVCSTASVPMADAFLKSGLSHGQALCYLLVGPITSYGTILVIRKDFGSKVLWVYLSVICVLSLFYGLLYDGFMKYIGT